VWRIGVFLHQAIMNESVLVKPFGDVLGYRYMMQIWTFDFERYIGAETSPP
jgi:hypothetical protein